MICTFTKNHLSNCFSLFPTLKIHFRLALQWIKERGIIDMRVRAKVALCSVV